jgi:hypothetical protein
MMLASLSTSLMQNECSASASAISINTVIVRLKVCVFFMIERKTYSVEGRVVLKPRILMVLIAK